MRSTALVRIPIGVVVERRKASSPWIDVLWRPTSVLVGTPSAVPWTQIGEENGATSFYAGGTAIELHRTETTNYRDNLASGAPALWVALCPVASGQPYDVLAVTADPAEGEALTDAGSNLVEAVSMPADVIEVVAQFIAEHHVERPFVRRRRERHAPSDRRERTGE